MDKIREKTEIKFRLYTLDAGFLKDKSRFNKLYNMVSDERRAKVDRLIPEDGKRLSLAGEGLLLYALSSMGVEPGDVEIGFGEKGKPYLMGREDVHFNVSHSGEYVVLAISDRPVGCDIEKIREYPGGIARRFFTREETNFLEGLEAGEQAEAFCRIWTGKESVIKALGSGLSMPLDAFRINLENGAWLSGMEEMEGYRLWEFADVPGYRCCVCTPEGEPPEVIFPEGEEIILGIKGDNLC